MKKEKIGHRPPKYNEAMEVFTVRVPQSMYKRLMVLPADAQRGILLAGLDGVLSVKPKRVSELDRRK